MKLLTKTIFIITILFLTTQVDVSYAARIGLPMHNSGLVGYWNFNEGTGDTAYDRSGSGNNGNLTDMAEDDWVTSKEGLGGALDFDGSNDQVNTSTSVGTLSAGTYSVWVRATTVSKQEGIINSGGTDSGGFDIFKWTVDLIYFRFGAGGSNQQSTSISSWNPNEWHHVVQTWDGSTGNGYIDGVLVVTGVTQSGSLSGAIDVGKVDSGYPFAGQIDEVRIYNRALSANEVNRLYNLTKPKITPITSTGLVGYWPFEEGQGTVAGDHSFNSNSGTLTTMDNSDWVDGKVGKALDFDGSSDYIDLGDKTDFEPSDAITISAWINNDTVPTNGFDRIVDKANAGGINTAGYRLMNEGDVWVFQWYTGSAQTGAYSTTLTSETEGKWTHIVGTHDGTTGRIYINTVSEDSTTAAFAGGANSTKLYIGNSASVNRYFDGRIDEVRIYDRALSSEEILKLYQISNKTTINKTKKDRITNDLVGHWTFDGSDIYSTTAYDSSSSGNDGTLVSGPTPTLGKIGQAINLDGINDYITADSVATAPPFTVVGWVRPDDVSRGVPFSFHSSGANRNLFFWAQDGATQKFYHWDGTNSYVASTNTFSTEEWHHIAWVIDSSNAGEMFVNGSSEGTWSNSDSSSANQFSIGQEWDTGTPSDFFDGQIDDLRVYNRTLSSEEINQLYNMGL